MRISGVKIDNFGVWHDLEIQGLPEGMTVFYGPNEAGKSTLMQFMRSVLYGYHRDTNQRYLPPVDRSGPAGGTLSVASHDGHFLLSRHTDAAAPFRNPGALQVHSRSGRTGNSSRLQSVLGAVDEPIFNNVFAVGLTELQQLGTLNATEAAERLYSLASGTDRVSLVDVMRSLRTTRMRLLTEDDGNGLVMRLLQKRTSLDNEVERMAEHADRWAEVQGEIVRLDEEIAKLEGNRDELRRQARLAEVAIQVQPKWELWRQYNNELIALGDVEELPADALERLADLNQKIEQKKAQLEDLKTQRNQLREEAAKLPLEEELAKNAARIRALVDQRNWIASLEGQVRRLEGQLEEIDLEIRTEQERLGITDGFRPGAPLRITRKMISKLRGPVKRMKEDRQRVTEAKRQATELREEAESVQKRIKQLLNGDSSLRRIDDKWSLVAEVEKTGALAAALRRRAQVDENLATMEDRLDDVNLRRAELLEDQLLPPRTLTTLGMFFTAGVMLAICGLFGGYFGFRDNVRWLMVLVGAAGVGATILMKHLMEIGSVDELDETDRQFGMLTKQHQELASEREDLEGALPPGNGSLADRLRDTETKLGNLEELLPLDSRRRETLKRAEDAEKLAIQAAATLTESQRLWQSTLRSLGLSSKLTPPQFKELIGKTGNVRLLEKQRQEIQNDLERAQRDLQSVTSQLTEIATQSLLKSIDESPLKIVDQLADGMKRHNKNTERRESLRGQSRQLRREYEKISKGIHQLHAKRLSIIASSGAEDEHDLKRMLDRRNQALELTGLRDDTLREIQDITGLRVNQDEIEQQLGAQLKEDNASRLQQAQQEMQGRDVRLKELIDRRGRLLQESQTLANSRQLAEAQLSASMAEQKLRDGLDQWKSISAITSMLESVYKRYERDRQPDTLKEASEYLAELTSNRYVRIWTPLSEDVLYVDDHDGKTLSVDVLSRGTREQVFLGLRLALASDYSRRGLQLPLILDDVLVNFDLPRTKAAAKLLRDYSLRGHQIIFFTCHEHIMNVFHDLDVLVREIPRHDGVVDEPISLATPKPIPLVAPQNPDVVTEPDPAPRPIKEVARPKLPKKRKTKKVVVDDFELPATAPIAATPTEVPVPHEVPVSVEYDEYEFEIVGEDGVLGEDDDEYEYVYEYVDESEVPNLQLIRDEQEYTEFTS
ncbi:MAG: AAA family ATPase [Pirellulaceae bacterium]|nr:AAA family ATPase [Planctomycetales bacterium]